jgi:DNA (cytosine-5)-methyltransferase 1
MSRAYYNEHDPFAAAWLRELIKAGLIADGDVDERSITEVTADDVRGYTQAHWFAGIGGWSYALRLAGWPDDRSVWTGSCPCQPFSAAGKQVGGRDDRHLWPHWARLIGECRPVTIFGEQVESAIAHGWLDAVFDDLEREGYACGAACLPAASVGAFHIRQRLWFVADAEGRDGRLPIQRRRSFQAGTQSERGREVGDLVLTCHAGLQGLIGHGNNGNEPGRVAAQPSRPLAAAGAVGGMADTECDGWRSDITVGQSEGRIIDGRDHPWFAADWIYCRDGKARPTEPGVFPLAHGVPARVGRLRGYGNAIVPHVAAEVIAAYLETV